jgi:hypothetical protein
VGEEKSFDDFDAKGTAGTGKGCGNCNISGNFSW